MQLVIKRQTFSEIMVRLYTFVVALLPVLATYASGIPGFSVADALLVVFSGYAILSSRKHCKNKYSINIKLLAFGWLLILMFNLISAFSDSFAIYDVVIRTIRYSFYLFCFAFTSKRMLDVVLLKSLVKKVSVLATVYIILQLFIYSVFGVVLKGFITSLPLYISDYALRDYETFYTTMFRPTSFFLEPAHFARYAVIGVAILIWDKNTNVNRMLAAIFISIGILISTSSQGYFLLFVVWLTFLLYRAFKINNGYVKLITIMGIVVFPFLIIGVLQLPYVQSTLIRSFSGDIGNVNSALGARLGSFEIIGEMTLLNKLFGVGFGTVPDNSWFPSAVYWIYGSGIIVFLVFVFFLLYGVFKLRGMPKIVLFIFLILFFTDDSFYSYMCVLFYSLALLISINDEENDEKNIVHSY